MDQLFLQLPERKWAGRIRDVITGIQRGRGESKVRQKLIETGAVEAMIAIRSNFFYTRTVPCELWFLNRDKPEEYKNKVLMIDARNVYRKVTRKIFDFSPEQLQKPALDGLAVSRRSRTFPGSCHRLSRAHVGRSARLFQSDNGQPLPDYVQPLDKLHNLLKPFLDSAPSVDSVTSMVKEFTESLTIFKRDAELFRSRQKRKRRIGKSSPRRMPPRWLKRPQDSSH